MIRNKVGSILIILVCLTFMGCAAGDNERNKRFDKFSRTIEIANWQYKLRVENQNEIKGRDVQGLTDHYLKYDDEYIYPIGYVFEPSNGLSKSERLVYKFQIAEDLYSKLMNAGDAVEYWYIDRMVGLGKICFKQQ